MNKIAQFEVKNGILPPFVVNIGKDTSDDSWCAWVNLEQGTYVVARGRTEVQPLALLVGMVLS